MRSPAGTLAFAGALLFASPGVAFALTGTESASAARIAVDAVALAVAIALLLDVLALRRVAEGSLFGENLVLVLVAVICLSASVLAAWVQLFLPGFTAEQVAFTRDLLILASMVVLGMYFFGVRNSMLRFARSYPGADEVLGQEEAAAAQTAEGGSGTDA